MRTVQLGSEHKAPKQNESGSDLDIWLGERPQTEQDYRPNEPASFPTPERWVPQRKAEVVDAVRGGFLSLDEACRRYALSVEEFLAWQHKIDQFGLAGLRVYGKQPRNRAETASGGLDTRPRRKPRRRPAKSGG